MSSKNKDTNENDSKNKSDNVNSSKNEKIDLKTKEKLKEVEQKDKEAEVVFKNSKTKKKKISAPSSIKDKVNVENSSKDNIKKESSQIREDRIENKDKIKDDEKKKISEKKNIETKLEMVKKTEETQRKDQSFFVITLVITILLVIILVLSVIFAMFHATKNTIARGVSVKSIDISNLTYNEAKVKLEQAFDAGLGVNINLKCGEFSHVIGSSDIELNYELTDSLNEAYSIGRNGNILQNNYSLLWTALVNKNIDFDFTYSDDALNTIIEYVGANVPNLVKQYSYYVEGDKLFIKPGEDGIKVNNEKLKLQIIESIKNRDLQELLLETKDTVIEIPYDNVKADSIDIDKIYGDVKKDPQNAYYVEATDTTEFEIHTDVDGIDFAISVDEAKQILSKTGETQYVIPLNISKAEITINDIGIEAFPYEVGFYSTMYDASNTNRSENLRIAASKINGTVLMPGEQFSFNNIVGERTISEGYKNAAIYSDGQVVDGLAGGICQISSTLYNAVLAANLQIDERHNHSFTTSYVRAGRDATVVYGVKDFKFTNTRKFPIKIETKISSGVAEFHIYGIKEENEYDVKIIPVVTATIPYTTKTIVDPSLAPGATVVSQGGASGSRVTTYKEVYLNGVQVSRDVISNDVYQVMTRIIRVGPTISSPEE